MDEASGEITYTVHKAELKMGFIVGRWQWTLDDVAEPLKEKFNVTIPLEKQGLALWVEVKLLNMTHMDVEGGKIDVKEDKVHEEEEPLEVAKRIRASIKFKFISQIRRFINLSFNT